MGSALAPFIGRNGLVLRTPTADALAPGQAIVSDGAGNLSFASVTTSPGGSSGELQYNNAGAFAGIAGSSTSSGNLCLANNKSYQIAHTDGSSKTVVRADNANTLMLGRGGWTSLQVASGGDTTFHDGNVLNTYVTIKGSGTTGTYLTSHGQLAVTAQSATTEAVKIQLAAAQTANAVEVNSSTGTGGNLAKIDSTGGVVGQSVRTQYSDGNNGTGLTWESGVIWRLSRGFGENVIARWASNSQVIGFCGSVGFGSATSGALSSKACLNSYVTDVLQINNGTQDQRRDLSLRSLYAVAGAATDIPVNVTLAASQSANALEVNPNGVTAGTRARITSTANFSNSRGTNESEYFGASAGVAGTNSGENNTGFGYYALSSNTTGYWNTAVGYDALRSNSTGYANVAVGHSTLLGIVSGSYRNVAIGYRAGTGTGNINEQTSVDINSLFLGTEASRSDTIPTGTQLSNINAIGYRAKVSISNAMSLGGLAGDSVRVGINTHAPGAQLHVVASSASTVGQVIQGAASQSVDLSQWNPNGVTAGARARVTAAGDFSNNAGGGLAIRTERFGEGATAQYDSGSAFGYNANTSDNHACAFGAFSSAAISSCAIGYSAYAGGSAVALGWDSTAATSGIAIGYLANAAANQFVSGSGTIPVDNVFFGKGSTHATPTAYTINGTGGSGTNIAGANLVLAGGKGTGTGAGGSVLIQTAAAGLTGSSLNALSTRLAVLADGKVGIGTASPNEMLEVSGSARFATSVGSYFVLGTASFDYVRFNVLSGNAGTTAVFCVGKDARFGFSSVAYGSSLISNVDTCIGRNAAGVLEVNNNTAGQLRDIKFRSMFAVAGAATDVPVNVNLAAAQSENAINVTSNGGTAGDIFKIASTGAVTSAASYSAPQTNNVGYLFGGSTNWGLTYSFGSWLQLVANGTIWRLYPTQLFSYGGSFTIGGANGSAASVTIAGSASSGVASDGGAVYLTGGSASGATGSRKGGIWSITGGDSSGTDNTGNNCIIAGTRGTGTGAGGSILLQVALASTTGSSANSVTTVGTIAPTSPNVLIQALAASHVPLSIKGAASQSGNYIECTTSAGSGGDLFRVTKDGYVYCGTYFQIFRTAGRNWFQSTGTSFFGSSGAYAAHFLGGTTSVSAYLGIDSAYTAVCGAVAAGTDEANSASNLTLFVGNNRTSATPAAGRVSATSGSGTDIAGASLSITGGCGTGTGVGGSVLVKVAPAGSAGASLNTLVTLVTVAQDKTITLADAVNLVVNATTGTKIGTDTTQKLGFYGATPVVQPANTSDLKDALTDLGLVATGAATPLNLDGGALTAGQVHINGMTLSWPSSNASGALTNDGAGNLTWTAGGGGGVTDHGALTGLSDDDHSIYALLAGRSGGQTLIGGTAAAENLTLSSTAHATKGRILFGTSGYDQTNNWLGINTAYPALPLHVSSNYSAGNIGAFNAGGTKGLTINANQPLPAIYSDYLSGSDSGLHLANYAGRSSSVGITIEPSSSGLVGINKSSSIGAQLHVVAASATTVGQIIQMAATPTAYPLEIRGNDDTRRVSILANDTTSTLEARHTFAGYKISSSNAGGAAELQILSTGGVNSSFLYQAWAIGGPSGYAALWCGDANSGQQQKMWAGLTSTFLATGAGAKFELNLGACRFTIGGGATANGATYATATSPTAAVVAGTSGSGTDIAGGSLTLEGGIGTGTGVGGSVYVSNAVAGTTGASLNSLVRTAQFLHNPGMGHKCALILNPDNGSYLPAYCFATTTATANTPFMMAAWNATNAYIGTGGVPAICWDSTNNLVVIGSTITASAQLHVKVGSASRVGQIIQLAATPAANAIEVNSSSGSGGDLFRVTKDGYWSIGNNTCYYGYSWGIGTGIRCSAFYTNSYSYLHDGGYVQGNNSSPAYLIQQLTGTFQVTAQSGYTNSFPNGFRFENPSGHAYSHISADGKLYLGRHTVGSTNIGVVYTAPTEGFLGAVGGQGTDIAGGNLAIAAGPGTGTAASGTIKLQASIAGSTGASLNSLSTVVTIAGTSPNVLIQALAATHVGLRIDAAASHSANLLEVRNNSGTNLLYFSPASGGDFRIYNPSDTTRYLQITHSSSVSKIVAQSSLQITAGGGGVHIGDAAGTSFTITSSFGGNQAAVWKAGTAATRVTWGDSGASAGDISYTTLNGTDSAGRVNANPTEYRTGHGASSSARNAGNGGNFIFDLGCGGVGTGYANGTNGRVIIRKTSEGGSPAGDTSYVLQVQGTSLFEKTVSHSSTTSTPTGTTQTIDWTAGNKQVLVLSSASGDVTLTFTAPSADASLRLKIVQGATARDITFPATVKWDDVYGERVWNLDANKTVFLFLEWDGTNYYASASEAYS